MNGGEREQRIQEICNDHMYDGDILLTLQLLSIERGIAEPSHEMLDSCNPFWMQELAILCKGRTPKVVLSGNALTIRNGEQNV